MSRSARIVLGIVTAIVFLCCVAGLGMTLLGTRLVGKAVITEPTRVAAVSQQIVSYELPAGFHEIFASDLLGFKMLAIGPTDPNTDLAVIMLMQLPSAMSVSEDELRQQMEMAMSQQTGIAAADLKVVGTQTTTIMEQSVTLTVREGRTTDDRALRQLSGLFSGSNGPVFLFVTGETSTWNQSLVDAFIASIH